MNKMPIIGVSGSQMKDSGGMFPGYPRAYVNHDYMRSVSENGGIPLILPCIPGEGMEERAAAYLDTVDGLILSGGHDLFPPFYGQPCRQKLSEVWPDRDRFDVALLEAAVQRKKPVFGICRGFQLINAHYGSTLLQDLSYAPHELLKHWQGHTPDLATQEVTFEGESQFKDLFGESVMVNSFHHQVVMEVGPELKCCGRTSDGVVEAVEHRHEAIIATQWHPEMMSATCPKMKQLFAYFIQKCARHEQ